METFFCSDSCALWVFPGEVLHALAREGGAHAWQHAVQVPVEHDLPLAIRDRDLLQARPGDQGVLP